MKNLVLMFPGQGSQAVGMGCDMAAALPEMRDAYAEASEVLGYDLQDLCCQGPMDRLSRTDFTQPALLAASVGMFRVLCDEGLRFDVAIGHSLGEFSALVATGAVSFRDALRIVRRRGQEMLRAADANPGGMAAIIGLDDAAVEALCAEVDGVWPANFNSPGQVVVSGRKAALELFGEKARAGGAKRVISLPVSGAFHSPLVEPALEPLREEFERTDWHEPDPEFFSGCTVQYEAGDFSHLLQVQLISPVRFTQSVKTLYEQGYDSFLEVGPGAVLTGLVKRIEPRAQAARVSDMETLQALRDDGRYLEDA
ncbi:MAG TPA: ACP S-malonyltransferase [Thermoleophilia bacterium]|nr:ACP S-malonyltransferase [Thermoleophilia bacterium]